MLRCSTPFPELHRATANEKHEGPLHADTFLHRLLQPSSVHSALALPREELDLDQVHEQTLHTWHLLPDLPEKPGESGTNKKMGITQAEPAAGQRKAEWPQGGQEGERPSHRALPGKRTAIPKPSFLAVSVTSQITQKSNFPSLPRGANGAYCPESSSTAGVCTGIHTRLPEHTEKQ